MYFALFLVVSCILSDVMAFTQTSGRMSAVALARSSISMEYIPDGLTKAQWAAIKKKEADDLKRKGDMSKMGATRFKSRSFEAWQKSGGKHLFPVDPRTTPYEERPYMQRKGGDPEGNDLKKKGLFGRGQGGASERNELDDYYENQAKAGKLNSASILGEGEGIPWTSKALNKRFAPKKGGTKKEPAAKAGKKLSAKELAARKKSAFKPIMTKSNAQKGATAVEEPAAEKPKKKGGLFGLF
jgi:hypothetical protein